MSSYAMVIRIKKGADGRTALSCDRPNGTTTWQRLQGGQATFFPRHDLTHYAVESVLGLGQGFFGLVADGWDLSDFGTPWPRGTLPSEANLVEMIVGFFDRERASGELGTADELNQHLASYAREHKISSPSPFSEADLDRVRQKRGELFRLWDELPPGQSLALPFDVEHNSLQGR
ncbi:MAG: hypothetical protein ABR585_03250 [Gemmatimonadaceae bacterium]